MNRNKSSRVSMPCVGLCLCGRNTLYGKNTKYSKTPTFGYFRGGKKDLQPKSECGKFF